MTKKNKPKSKSSEEAEVPVIPDEDEPVNDPSYPNLATYFMMNFGQRLRIARTSCDFRRVQ